MIVQAQQRKEKMKMPRRQVYACKVCHAQVLNVWDFCPYCGTKVDQSMFYGKVQGIPKPKEES